MSERGHYPVETYAFHHAAPFRKTSAGDLAGTMSNRERAAKLFLQFSGGKNHWTADDMSDFCSAIWKQDGSLAAVTSGIFTRDLFGGKESRR